MVLEETCCNIPSMCQVVKLAVVSVWKIAAWITYLSDTFYFKLFNCFFQIPIKMEVPVKEDSCNICNSFKQEKIVFQLKN